MPDLDLEPNEDIQASHHRWLLSYADLMTLLFSLFVVLFSTTYAGQKKAEAVSKGVREAFGERAAAVKPVPKPSDDPGLMPVKDRLEDLLKLAIASGKTEIQLESRGLVIHLKDVSFFPPGESDIRPEGYEIIERIASVVGPLPNPIAVEGHSDGVAIHNSRFRDNWELSAARSVSMLRFLAEGYGIPQARMSATAFADTRPLSDNISAVGRAQNRRVDIVILSAPLQKVTRPSAGQGPTPPL
jgi:chemotaxis protein MotB